MEIKKKIRLLLSINILLLISFISYLIYNEIKRENYIKTITQHPEIISNLIDSNPELFTAAIKNAASVIKPELTVDQKKQLQIIKQSNYDSVLYENDIILYPNNKEQVIVYTDFECPFCRGQFKVLQEFKNLSLIIRPVALSSHKKGQFLSLILLYINYYHKDKAATFYTSFFEHQDEFLKLSQQEVLDQVNQILNSKITVQNLLNDKKIILHLAFIKNEASKIKLDSVPSLHIKNHVSSGLTSKEIIENLIL